MYKILPDLSQDARSFCCENLISPDTQNRRRPFSSFALSNLHPSRFSMSKVENCITTILCLVPPAYYRNSLYRNDSKDYSKEEHDTAHNEIRRNAEFHVIF